MVALAFEQYDKDNTGTVSKNQLKKFLERFNIPFSKVWAQNSVIFLQWIDEDTKPINYHVLI